METRGAPLFHKIKNATPLPNYKIKVQFENGGIKIYDVAPLFNKIFAFIELKTSPEMFEEVRVSEGGYGIIWNDHLDLSCDEIWENGV